MNFQERVEKWAEDRNLIHGSAASLQLAKLLEEVGELATAVAIGDMSGSLDAIGDTCVVLAIMAKQLDSGLSECQELAWEEIKDRRGYIDENGLWKKVT